MFYELLKKNICFTWTNRHESILRRLVDDIAAAVPLTMFDSSRSLFLCCNASDKGIGAVLSHDVEQKEIVWCASRVLTKAEKNYSNFEREALSIIFGMKRFSSCLGGKHFTVITDHRPLKYIFDTSLL